MQSRYDVSIDIYPCYQLLKVMAHLMRISSL